MDTRRLVEAFIPMLAAEKRAANSRLLEAQSATAADDAYLAWATAEVLDQALADFIDARPKRFSERVVNCLRESE